MYIPLLLAVNTSVGITTALIGSPNHRSSTDEEGKDSVSTRAEMKLWNSNIMSDESYWPSLDFIEGHHERRKVFITLLWNQCFL